MLVNIPLNVAFILLTSYLLNMQTNGNRAVSNQNQPSRLKKFIHISTDEVFGDNIDHASENHKYLPSSPYSASKIAADQLAISYNLSYGLPIKIVRPFNTYGPRQSARAIIPTVISQILSNKKRIELGNLTPTRDLTYVSDTCQGFIEIFKSDKLFGEVTNIGMNQEISIGDLVILIAKILNKSIEVIPKSQRIRPKGSEVNRLLCDNKKLLKSTNWRPKVKLKDGIISVYDWMTKSNNLAIFKSNKYNV